MLNTFAEKALGRRINLLFRLSMTYLRREMEKLEVGTGDYVILFMLFLDDGLSQDELSRRMRVDKSYTARAVAKMEKMGLVRREPDPEAWRVKRVFLETRALALRPRFFSIVKDWQEILARGIPEQELEIVLAGLDRMMANAENHLGLDPLPPFWKGGGKGNENETS